MRRFEEYTDEELQDERTQQIALMKGSRHKSQAGKIRMMDILDEIELRQANQEERK